jgi:hypothetical protein
MLTTGPDVIGLSRREARETRIRFWREKVGEALASSKTQTEFCEMRGSRPGLLLVEESTESTGQGAEVGEESPGARQDGFRPGEGAGVGDGGLGALLDRDRAGGEPSRPRARGL